MRSSGSQGNIHGLSGVGVPHVFATPVPVPRYRKPPPLLPALNKCHTLGLFSSFPRNISAAAVKPVHQVFPSRQYRKTGTPETSIRSLYPTAVANYPGSLAIFFVSSSTVRR